MEATLRQENLKRYCPTTNLYECTDRWLLVTAPCTDALQELAGGLMIPIMRSHIPKRVDVFLSDESGAVLDADGDPSNGMTPVARFEGAATHEEALAELGYELT